MTIFPLCSSTFSGSPLRASPLRLSLSEVLSVVGRISGFSHPEVSPLPLCFVRHVRGIHTATPPPVGCYVKTSFGPPKRALLRFPPHHSIRESRPSRFASTGGESTDAGGGSDVSFVSTEDAKRRNLDPECVAFVTGANRGIGLEITRQLLERTKGKVIAACRDPSSALDLQALDSTTGNEDRLDIVSLDVTDQASVERAAAYIKTNHGRLDLLFNVAGILGNGKSTPGPERSLRAMERDWLRHTLEVNAVGPMMLAAAFAPLLESPAKKGQEGTARTPSVVVNFSARVGSIGDNSLGGWHSYRMSKAALNMATKGISVELRRRRVWAFSYHPGTTDTGLSKPFQANVRPEKLFTTTYTASQVLGIVDSMTEGLSGGFYAFDGSRIEW